MLTVSNARAEAVERADDRRVRTCSSGRARGGGRARRRRRTRASGWGWSGCRPRAWCRCWICLGTGWRARASRPDGSNPARHRSGRCSSRSCACAASTFLAVLLVALVGGVLLDVALAALLGEVPVGRLLGLDGDLLRHVVAGTGIGTAADRGTSGGWHGGKMGFAHPR